jgi:hypothetical protein
MNPVPILAVFLAGGVGSTISWTVIRLATKKDFTLMDLLPPPPGEGPPVPRGLLKEG